jgi:hypothetical protein
MLYNRGYVMDIIIRDSVTNDIKDIVPLKVKKYGR